MDLATVEARIDEFNAQKIIEIEKLSKYFRDIENEAIGQLRETDWTKIKGSSINKSGNTPTVEYFEKLISIVQGLKFTSDENVYKDLGSVIYTGSLKKYFISYEKLNKLVNVLYEKLGPVIILEPVIFQLISIYLDFKIEIEISAMAGLVKYEYGSNGDFERPLILDLLKKLQRRKKGIERKTAIRKISISMQLHSLIQQLQVIVDPSGNQLETFLNEIVKDRLEKMFAIEIAGSIIFLKSELAKKALNVVLFDFFVQLFVDLDWLSELEFEKKSLEGNIEFYSSYRQDYSRYKYRQVVSLLNV